MKLGMSFNVFSGADLLKPAILNASHSANYIVCVFSKVSNTGESAPAYLEPLLQDLLREGYVDEVICHSPIVTQSLAQMQGNNRQKRILGKEACKRAGCTHYMSRDCDEFYDVDLFKNALFKLSTYDFTACRIYEYALCPTRRNPELSGLYVPVIHDINLDYKCNRSVPVLLDKERTVTPIKKYYVHSPDELVMHHMCGVRYNSEEYVRKQHGHPHFIRTKVNPNTYESSLKDQLSVYSQEVNDQFGILEYWEKEFVKYV